MKCGRAQWQEAGGNKKNSIDPSGQEILYLRALQGHSGRNLIYQAKEVEKTQRYGVLGQYTACST